jgi:hypothetical protein
MPDALDAFLRGGFEGLARKLGHDDPQRQRWKPPANENERRKNKRRLPRHAWNKVCATVLSLWTVFGLCLAYLVLLWDEHHYRDFGAD